jgi:hypothetical protein
VGYKGLFKVRYYRCGECGEKRDELAWEDDLVECCGQQMQETSRYGEAYGTSAAIHGDEIDQVIEHGVCHDNGEPRRFRSRTELKRALEEKGLCHKGDTPKTGTRWV